jgi:hypothetical protein
LVDRLGGRSIAASILHNVRAFTEQLVANLPVAFSDGELTIGKINRQFDNWRTVADGNMTFWHYF